MLVNYRDLTSDSP